MFVRKLHFVVVVPGSSASIKEEPFNFDIARNSKVL
jgi:hypothetical protein